MPILKARETKKINLVTDPEAWVEVFTKQTYGDYLKIQKAMLGQGMDMAEETKKNAKPSVKADISAFMLATLETMVVGWNYTDESNNVLPLTQANLLLLDKEDGLTIFNAVSEDAGLPQDEESQNLEKAS